MNSWNRFWDLLSFGAYFFLPVPALFLFHHTKMIMWAARWHFSKGNRIYFFSNALTLRKSAANKKDPCALLGHAWAREKHRNNLGSYGKTLEKTCIFCRCIFFRKIGRGGSDSDIISYFELLKSAMPPLHMHMILRTALLSWAEEEAVKEGCAPPKMTSWVRGVWVDKVRRRQAGEAGRCGLFFPCACNPWSMRCVQVLLGAESPHLQHYFGREGQVQGPWPQILQQQSIATTSSVSSVPCSSGVFDKDQTLLFWHGSALQEAAPKPATRGCEMPLPNRPNKCHFVKWQWWKTSRLLLKQCHYANDLNALLSTELH